VSTVQEAVVAPTGRIYAANQRKIFEDDDWIRLAQAVMKNTGGDFFEQLNDFQSSQSTPFCGLI
jgi:hypothetical protein